MAMVIGLILVAAFLAQSVVLGQVIKRLRRAEKKVAVVHWEANVLARLFTDAGVNFNSIPLDDITDEFVQTILAERPGYFLGIVHDVEVNIQGTSGVSN